MQQQTFHDSGAVDPPQMLIISPPSQHNASGTYDFVIVSPAADSDWPFVMTMPNLYLGLVNTPILVRPLPSS